MKGWKMKFSFGLLMQEAFCPCLKKEICIVWRKHAKIRYCILSEPDRTVMRKASVPALYKHKCICSNMQAVTFRVSETH